jgi:hypothetical protein
LHMSASRDLRTFTLSMGKHKKDFARTSQSDNVYFFLDNLI